ncbi:MAG: MFS transporter [Hyphomonadaceae bacterium]|nr:MFS transporter [Hyphomonadaceae bacterium]
MTQAVDDARPAAPVINPVSDGYRAYAMWMLLIVYILNFVDRQVINILAEPIKNELGLLDWQVGAMSGLAFALFYTVLGLPIARYAERGHRPRIIAVALALWSGFTALCGLAQNFTQLVLARIGVGIGEAGCTPPAHSLITDYVPKEKRASGLAFYSMGTPLGSLVGMGLGGVVADAWGWRAAFIVCGLPGLLMAVVVALTLIEPRAKRVAADVRAAGAKGVTFTQALAVLAKKRTFWLVALAAAVKAFIGYGHAPFTASFFFRNHTEEIARLASLFGLQSAGFLGLALGIVGGVAGAFGAYVGGQIADKYGGRDLRAYVSVPAIAALATIPIYITAVLLPSALGAMCLLAINAILGTLWYGPVYATAQSIAPAHMRATASAILLFIINLVGLGLGPLLVGALSDVLAIQGGMGKAEGVRWALIISALSGVASAVFFWMARKTIRTEMEG